MRCPNCQLEHSEGTRECSRCGIVFAKWSARSAPGPARAQASSATTARPRSPAPAPGRAATAPPDAAVRAVLALDTARPRDRRLEAWLLVLSFPIVVPSLVVNWLMASRWGRVDFLLIAFDGLVIALFAMGSTPMLLLVVLAWLASGLLCILRADRLLHGIFLGYSNAVAYRLIFGGILFAIGSIGLVPWGVYGEISRVLSSERSVDAAALTEHRTRGLAPVVVPSATLDWERRAYRTATAAGPRFSGYAPGAAVAVSDPRELWQRHDELVGSPVALEAAVGTSYLRSGVEFDLVAGGAKTKGLEKQRDPLTRAYAPVRGTGGRVWLISEPIGGAADPAFAARTAHAGTLVHLYSDEALAQQYVPDDRHQLPYMAVGILPGAGASAKSAPADVATWIPVAGTDDALWVVYQGALSEPPAGPVRGIYLGSGAVTAGLLEHVKARFQKTTMLRDPHVIDAVGRLAYVRREGLFSRFVAGIGWGALVALLPGLGLIVWATWLATRE